VRTVDRLTQIDKLFVTTTCSAVTSFAFMTPWLYSGDGNGVGPTEHRRRG